MEQRYSFRLCPRCGLKKDNAEKQRFFHCDGCDFSFYFNPATAVVGIVTDAEGRVLLIRRANEPAKGKLAMPGGFVDFNEPVEDALRREMREEVNVQLSQVQFLCSFPNRYVFKGLTYHTVDLFFTAGLRSGCLLYTSDAADE